MSHERFDTADAPGPWSGTAWSRRRVLLSGGAVLLAGTGAASAEAAPSKSSTDVTDPRFVMPTRAEIVKAFKGRTPRKFGMFLAHTVTSGQRRVSLTFDACGGSRGSKYDEAVIKTLRHHKVPATLFLNSRWIEANLALAAELAADPLFEIGNHGWNHVPLTVAGQSAYGITGTRGAGEAYDELVRGLDAVAELTGARPRWFRPGTAWVDDVGVAIARRIGVEVVSFSINADAGATASKAEITANLKRARRHDITLAHFNQPGGKTAEGLASVLPSMVRAGRHFGTLSKNIA